ncbi:restriction endonuclease subunit S [Deinococcus taklimakanensis]|uniref:Restriction endonuclease subunit S n=1 Tax=Deinococcus taklimakanensis TaxID=536443 RepID=A0ABW5NYE2_9DEIO
MSELVKLGTVLSLLKDGTHGTHKRFPEGIPLLSAKDISAGRFLEVPASADRIRLTDYQALHKNYVIQDGDILLTIVGTLGRVNKVREAPLFTVQRSVAVLRPNQFSAIPSYLYHALKDQNFQKQLVGSANSTAQAGVYLNALADLYVSLPPLPEQRRIAEILDTLDRTIEATQRIIEKLQATRQGLLHDLLTRGLDAKGQLRDPERNPELFHETELGLLPREWKIDYLLNHVDLPSGQVDPRFEPYNSMYLIAADHIQSGTGQLLEMKTASEQGAISGKYLFKSDDVLYSKIRPNLRKATLVNFHGICSADMYPLTSRHTLFPGYLIQIILGEDFSRFAIAVSMRSGFPKINREELGEFRMPIPPLDEQIKISAVLAASEKQSDKEKSRLIKLQALKRGLMEDLLTGRVRVALSDNEIEDSNTRSIVQSPDPANSPDLPHYIPPQPPVAAQAPMYRAAAGAQAQPMTQWTQDLAQAVQGQQVGLYSPEALDAVLPELLALTIDRHGLLRVPEVLAKAGIRFMLLPHPDGSKANGAAFYLDEKRRQPVVGLSLRFPYLDVFWFNLLHELAHIRLGHQPVPDESLEQYDQHSPDEQAANRWAQDTLIPPQDWQELYARHPVSDQQLLALARKLGRHVAIVAGRYGHETGNWGRVNSPKLRPSAVAELKELGQQLKGQG